MKSHDRLKESNFVCVMQCPVCKKNDSFSVARNVRTINESSDMVVELRECTCCKHWWHNPMPTQQTLISLYKERSGFVLGKELIESIKELKNIGLNEVKPFERSNIRYLPYFELTSRNQLNVLEIGCGIGKLFQHFRGKANHCYGVEPGNWLNHPCIVSDVSELPQHIKFDVIILHDVLEHVENPVHLMAQCRSLANEDARIYCAFPNKDSWAAKIKREKWLMIRPLGHLHYFSERSISIMFHRAGWEISRRDRYPSPTLKNLLGSLRKIFRIKSFLKDIKSKIFLCDQWYVVGIAGNG